jgi:hypothetical protein
MHVYIARIYIYMCVYVCICTYISTHGAGACFCLLYIYTHTYIYTCTLDPKISLMLADWIYNFAVWLSKTIVFWIPQVQMSIVMQSWSEPWRKKTATHRDTRNLWFFLGIQWIPSMGSECDWNPRSYWNWMGLDPEGLSIGSCSDCFISKFYCIYKGIPLYLTGMLVVFYTTIGFSLASPLILVSHQVFQGNNVLFLFASSLSRMRQHWSSTAMFGVTFITCVSK